MDSELSKKAKNKAKNKANPEEIKRKWSFFIWSCVGSDDENNP